MRLVNLHIWFGDALAYWLNIPEDMATRILQGFENSDCGMTDHLISIS